MIHRGKAWRGYFSEGAEKTAGQADYKEGLYFGIEHTEEHPLVQSQHAMHGQNQWPKKLPLLRDTVLHYMQDLQNLAQKILACIALSLGLPASYFDHKNPRINNKWKAAGTVCDIDANPVRRKAQGLNLHTHKG